MAWVGYKSPGEEPLITASNHTYWDPVFSSAIKEWDRGRTVKKIARCKYENILPMNNREKPQNLKYVCYREQLDTWPVRIVSKTSSEAPYALDLLIAQSVVELWSLERTIVHKQGNMTPIIREGRT